LAIIGAALALTVAAGPSRADFGTGVSLGSTDPGFSFSPATPISGVPLSQDAQVLTDSQGSRSLAAKAVADPSSFLVGASTTVSTPPGLGGAAGHSQAVAYSDFSVGGILPAGGIPASLNIDGSALRDPSGDGDPFVNISVSVLDPLGNTVQGGSFALFPAFLPVSNYRVSNFVTGSVVFNVPFTGTAIIPFTIPVSTGRLELNIDDVAVAARGATASANFLNTATLNITPPPGVSVTLDTGEQFASVTPEPGSLALLATGVLPLLGGLRRRARGSRSSRLTG
jgi:hypothetical protein